MYRPGIFKLVTVGVLLGLCLAPLVWFGVATSTRAQTLPFTPTPAPTDTPTVLRATAAAPLPTDTATPAPTQPPIVLVATPTPAPMTATPRPTAVPGYGRDACDPNHTLQQPCALATETDVAHLNFNDGSTDVFSFLLKGGRQYQIRATGDPAGGLDPALTVFTAGATDAPVAENDDAQIGDPSAAVTVTVQLDAWYLVQVTNTAPGAVEGKTYTLSARSVAAAGSAATPEPTYPDDLVGNAYDPAHAARLAWAVPYDLSMLCPDTRPGACYAGRHTFLLVPVKGGVPFTALTYDLGEGVDTVLTLYKPDATQQQEQPGELPGWRAVLSNDDIATGWTLRSQITLVPDWNGVGLLVVAPSDRADMPTVPTDGRPGRYRLIVGSPELSQVKAARDSQDDLPPTPTPTEPPPERPTSEAAPAVVVPQPAQDEREVVKEACPTGQALVGTETGFFAAAPPGVDDRLAGYPPEALVALLGQCYRGWVKVLPADSVTPGWMWGPNLRPYGFDSLQGPLPEGTGMPTSGTPGVTSTPDASAGQFVATPTTRPAAAAVTVTALDALSLPTGVPARPAARARLVEVCQAAGTGTSCGTPLAGVRVELLLTATRQSLTANATDPRGRVTLSVSVPEGSQILLAIPALGLELPLDATTTEVPIRVPGGGN